MIHKSMTINARIEPALKKKAENILGRIGITSAEAIRIFYKQICLHQGLPFAVKVPNATTQKAIMDVENRRTYRVKNTAALFEEIK